MSLLNHDLRKDGLCYGLEQRDQQTRVNLIVASHHPMPFEDDVPRNDHIT